MATTITTTPTVTSVTTSWLKLHERLVIVLLVLLFGGYAYSKYADLTAARADAKVVAAQQQVADAKANTAAALLQASQTAAQYQAMVTALTQQNEALAQAVTQRNVVLTQAQTVVQTASVPDVVSAWQKQVPVGSIVSSTSGIVVDSTAARETVSQLLALPVAQANLADEQKVNTNLNRTIVEADAVYQSEEKAVAACKVQLTTDASACTAQLNAAKAESRKGKIRWFKIGYVAGFLSGLWAGHSAGL